MKINMFIQSEISIEVQIDMKINMFIQSFFTRQRAFVRFWLQFHALESEEVSAYHVQCLINGWVRPPVQRKRKRKNDEEDDSVEIPAEVLAFVKQDRQLLSNPTNFAITSRTSVECLLLPYLYHILEFYREYGNSAATRSSNDGPVLCSVTSSRGFSIAPVCRIKRHFLTIDTTVLYELLKDVTLEADPKLCPDWLSVLGKMSLLEFRKKENEGLQKTTWDAAFNIDGLRKRRTFGRQIDTDGVSLTVHFQVTKRHRARHQKRIQGRPDEYNTSSPLIQGASIL